MESKYTKDGSHDGRIQGGLVCVVGAAVPVHHK